MPKGLPPPPVQVLTGVPFTLWARENGGLTNTLDLEGVPSEVSRAIAEAIACYTATKFGFADTTVGNTLVELAEINKKTGRAYRRSAFRLADDRSGVDYTMHGLLQPLAKAVIEDKPGAEEALTRAACTRAEEI